MNPELEGYTIVNHIGSGSFAEVYFAIHDKTSHRVAIKRISRTQDNEDGLQDQRIQFEISLLQKMHHPFIADLYDVVTTEDYVYLVMEYIQCGTLLKQLNEKSALPEKEATFCFAQIMLAMKYLHEELQIVHRDIKAENVLFDQHMNIRIIDFGLSRNSKPGSMMQTLCGSPAYAPPEMIIGQNYTNSADIWSCGVVLYSMVFRKLPFYHDNTTIMAKQIVYNEPDIPRFASPSLVDLLKKLLSKTPSLRPSADEILKHPWLSHAVETIEQAIKNAQNTNIKKVAEAAGVNVEEALADIKNNVYTPNSVTYRIIQKVELSDAIPCLSQEKRVRRVSSRDALPRLQRPDTPSEEFSRASLPIHVSSRSPSTKRKKIYSPIIRLNYV